jgi:adenylate kinase
MGRPGPQKHAHAARLAEVLAVPYISMGTLVRQELSPTSSLYKKVRPPPRYEFL